jgi:hypothetical protein
MVPGWRAYFTQYHHGGNGQQLMIGGDGDGDG